MANATIIYACTQDGLLIFNKPGTLAGWLPPRMVLKGRAVLSAWAEPGPPIRVLATAVDSESEGIGMGGELLLSENGGRDWQVRLAAPVTTITGLADDHSRLYAGMAAGGMAGSADGGNTWGILPGFEEGGSVRSILADSKEPGRFYVLLDLGGGEMALLDGKLREGAWELETRQWRRQAIDGVQALSQDALTDDLYAATPDGVYMSADKGDTWSPLPGSPAGGSAILAIPGPQDAPAALVVGTPSALLVSPDGGGIWQQADLSQPGGVIALARDPERRDRLYAAISTGYIFESGNRGQSWQSVNGEPAGQVSHLFVIRI
jgi:hypothetical protein